MSIKCWQLPKKGNKEAELFRSINQGIPEDVQIRFEELIAKREAETLSSEDHEELLEITKQIEALEAQRVQTLIELVNLRGISLSDLMEKLGIPASLNT